MRSATRSRFAAILLLWTCFAACAIASGESRALVRTVTTSAVGEAHGVYVHTVDVESNEDIGVPLWLPGDAPAGPIHLSSNGRIAATGARTRLLDSSAEQHVAVFGAFPVPPLTAGWFESPRTGIESLAGFVAFDSQDWVVTYAATTLPGNAGERGTITMRPIGKDGAATGPATRQLVSGIPAAGVTFNDNASAAVLAWDRDTGHWAIHVIDPGSRTGLRSSLPLDDRSRIDGNTNAAALGVTADSRYFLALIADSASERSEIASTLFAVDSETLAAAGAISIPGIPDDAVGAVVPAGSNAAWIVSRDPTSAFGYSTYVEVSESGLSIKDDPSYTALDSAPIVAVAVDLNVAAIGAGNSVEIRAAGEGVQHRRRFAAPIHSLAWHGPWLLVGEGGRLHRVNADDLSVGSVLQFQDGQIDAIMPLPPTAWDPEDADGDGLDKRQELELNSRVYDPDSDADGLFDGVDPDVRLPNPVLIVDPEIRLRATAAGYQKRLLRIDALSRTGGRWTIQYDRASAPWLAVDAMTGAIPGGPRLHLDPGALPQTTASETMLELRAVGVDEDDYAGSPMTVRVRVVHPLAPPRRIAWAIGDPENRERMERIVEALSGPPYHFTHDYAPAGATLDARNFAIVVMDESAAAQSMITRRGIAEFVRSGGSLVFIRASSGHAVARATESWLAPLGITLTPGESASQGASVHASHPLARWWRPSWRSLSGRLFSVQAPGAVVLAANDSGAFATTGHYGLGRMAVFASPSPLFDSGREQRQFVSALFTWLSRSAYLDDPGQRDVDGDALPDWLEDRDRNGMYDPGETDWVNPDTDGDGLPDGSEDFNLNGVLEAGETSPLNNDTDGDGIWDGADVTPIPPFAAPLIATVYPNSSPAQGGRTITIQGRNLRTNQRVWFGDRLATDVRAADASAMSVVVPPASLQSLSTVVDVRIEDTGTGLETTAAGAFTYSDPALVWMTVSLVPESAGPNLGVLSLRISSREKVAVGRVVLTVDTSPSNAITWGELEPGVAASSQGRSVTGSAAQDGSLSIAIGASRNAQGMGELVTIPWTFAGPPGEPVRVHLRNARVAADNGYPLQVDASASIHLQ